MQRATRQESDVRAAPPVTALAAPHLRLHGPGDPQRHEVEQFIAGVFARRFGARVPAFAPLLVSLRDPVDGALVAAAGYRPARHGPLYLERYLNGPVEAVLGRHLHAAPQRDHLVEVGHLAASRAGAGRRLLILLGAHLEQQGFRWLVCTLTQELRHLLPRLGITPLALARAEPCAVADEAGAWGSYYEHAPVVLAGELQPALRRFRARAAAAGGLA
jgi:hypothetical protein